MALVIFLFIIGLIALVAWFGGAIILVVINSLAITDVGLNPWNLIWLIVGCVMILFGVFSRSSN